MSVRQYEEERQKREQFLKRENEALNRHKGELIDKVWALESENKRLREALEFYADKNNHVEYHESDYVKYNERGITEISRDKGQIARLALEGDTNA